MLAVEVCAKNNCLNMAALDMFLAFRPVSHKLLVSGTQTPDDGMVSASLLVPGTKFNVILVSCGSFADGDVAAPILLVSDAPIVLVVDSVVSRSKSFLSHPKSWICES